MPPSSPEKLDRKTLNSKQREKRSRLSETHINNGVISKGSLLRAALRTRCCNSKVKGLEKAARPPITSELYVQVISFDTVTDLSIDGVL